MRHRPSSPAPCLRAAHRPAHCPDWLNPTLTHSQCTNYTRRWSRWQGRPGHFLGSGHQPGRAVRVAGWAWLCRCWRNGHAFSTTVTPARSHPPPPPQNKHTGSSRARDDRQGASWDHADRLEPVGARQQRWPSRGPRRDEGARWPEAQQLPECLPGGAVSCIGDKLVTRFRPSDLV